MYENCNSEGAEPLVVERLKNPVTCQLYYVIPVKTGIDYSMHNQVILRWVPALRLE